MRPQVTEDVRLANALLKHIPAESLTVWLQNPNPVFGGRKPWTLIQN